MECSRVPTVDQHAASNTWIEIGEVLGTKNELHRIPVEIETATGVQTLYLEYHDNDNAFEAAQSFIDKHGVLLTSLLDYSSTKTIWMKQRSTSFKTVALAK